MSGVYIKGITKDDVIGLKSVFREKVIEVKEHGRLIDADALINDADDFSKRIMLHGGTLVYSQSAIDNAPTVIPSDRCSDDVLDRSLEEIRP